MGAAGPAETGGSGFPDLCQSVTALGQHFDVCAACTILSGAPRKTDGSQVSVTGSQVQDISVYLALAYS